MEFQILTKSLKVKPVFSSTFAPCGLTIVEHERRKWKDQARFKKHKYF